VKGSAVGKTPLSGHQWAPAATVTGLVIALALVVASPAGASPKGADHDIRSAVTATKVKHPPKVRARSTWTLRLATGCESDTFAPKHAFTATDDTHDSGTYEGTKKLTMTWTTGLGTGGTFSGTWRAADGDYIGTYTIGGQIDPATLSSGATQCLYLGPTTPVLSFGASVPQITPGNSEGDLILISGVGGVFPTGTVDFYVCQGTLAGCPVANEANVTELDSTALSPTSDSEAGPTAVADSVSFTPPGAGDFCFLAVYSGDSNYTSASAGTAPDQCFTVASAAPGTATMTTQPNPNRVPVGQATTDTATVTGWNGVIPTGTVSFSVCGPETGPALTPCTFLDLTPIGSPVTLVGVNGSSQSTASTTFTPSAAGNYCVTSVYSGDGHYSGAEDESTTHECIDAYEPP
jgi:hypothetical protein